MSESDIREFIGKMKGYMEANYVFQKETKERLTKIEESITNSKIGIAILVGSSGAVGAIVSKFLFH